MFEVMTDAVTGEVITRLYTEAEIFALQPTNEQLAVHIRAERNCLLAASDWTQLIDAPVNIVAWGEYRKALRDITAQLEFPANVIWPTSPKKME